MKKLRISFEGKQNELEAEDCSHSYEPDVIMIRGDSLFIAEGVYMREIDLNKPIKKFMVEIVGNEKITALTSEDGEGK